MRRMTYFPLLKVSKADGIAEYHSNLKLDRRLIFTYVLLCIIRVLFNIFLYSLSNGN